MLALSPSEEVWLKHLREIILFSPFLAYIYYLLAAACARRFFGRHGRPHADFLPPASILKPVRGLDREAYENFASFCRLDYPEYEVLFGVSDPTDPSIPVIQQIIRDFPEHSITLSTGLSSIGHNDKASILAHLAREAKNNLLVASDSDTRAEKDYLRVLVAPFSNPKVGAVTCLYRGIQAGSLAETLEAVGISSDFFSGVFVASQFAGVRFALGAAMATTRDRLQEIGGFETLAGFLLDDYELGRRISERGYHVELLPYAVSMVLPAESFRGFWQRQLRWAVGIRSARPWSHLGLLLAQGLPLSLIAAVLSRSGREACAYIAAYLVTRFMMAWTVGVWGLKDPILLRKWWLVPLRDATAFCAWLASFRYNRVKWRGNAFYVRKGQLVPAAVGAETDSVTPD